MKNQNIFNWLKHRGGVIMLITCIASVWLSCRKDEEPPIPVGQPIKYTAPMMASIDSALQKSPYTLFYAAWKKGQMDSILVSAKAGALTIYAPTDSALAAAGYTATQINNTSKGLLDSLLAFHVVLGTYTDSTLAAFTGSAEATTLLTNPNPQRSFVGDYQYFSASNPYTYSLFVSADNKSFSINGKTVKTANKPINAKYATIYPINQVLQRPTKDILALLHADPQFSYLLAAYKTGDSVIVAHSFFEFNGTDTTLLALSISKSNTTLFAPTNDAFKKFLADFYHKNVADVTINDLHNYQSRPLSTWSFTSVSPMDSVIGSYKVNYGFGRNVFSSENRPLVTGSTWLYTDLLYNAAALDNYVVTPANPSGGYAAVTIDLDFIHTGTTVQVKRHSSNTSPPVNITQHDIIATNGVIHIVDGLLKL